jgi:(p)ppGpp synthase/HD superfamily hydrolase
MFDPGRYVETMRFAAAKHNAQKEPGSDLPYLVHVVSVAAEVIVSITVQPVADPELAVTCALLHDTVEDTDATLEELSERFGDAVAAGVAALSKNPNLAKLDQMADSLRRIRDQPPEVALVKLADRTINMSAPPHYWSKEKCTAYRVEAGVIADMLGSAHTAQEARLRARIEAYKEFCI